MANWADVPTELRLEILRKCLVKSKTITALKHANTHAPKLLNLTRISRDMRTLAMEVYYKENTFAFSRSSLSDTGLIIFHFPKAPIAQMLRRIEIHIELDAAWQLLQDMFSRTYISDRRNWELTRYVASHPENPYSNDRKAIDRHFIQFDCEADARPRFDVPADIIAVFRTNQDRNKERSQRAELKGWETHMPRTHANEVPVYTWSRDPILPRRTWIQTLSNLRHAKILIYVERCINHEKQHAVLRDLAGRFRTSRCAEEVEVVVDVPGCKWRPRVGQKLWGWCNDGCVGKCAEVYLRGEVR